MKTFYIYIYIYIYICKSILQAKHLLILFFIFILFHETKPTLDQIIVIDKKRLAKINQRYYRKILYLYFYWCGVASVTRSYIFRCEGWAKVHTPHIQIMARSRVLRQDTPSTPFAGEWAWFEDLIGSLLDWRRAVPSLHKLEEDAGFWRLDSSDVGIWINIVHIYLIWPL